MPDNKTSLLDPQFLRRLDRLELETRRVLGGAIKGDRRSKKKGVSIDFADYRHYVRGDDLRFVDWNLYGRLDRLFIKIFYEEQDLQCHLLLDSSRSMHFGDPDKMDYAKRIAAGLAYIGLTGSDKIGITCFHSGTSGAFPASRGRHNVRRMLSFLEGMAADGRTSLLAATRELVQRVKGKSIVIILSDFLDPGGFEPALRYLIRDTLDVFVIQVMSPQEIDPNLIGHIELHDLEILHKVELTITPRLKQQYKRNVEAYCQQIKDYCTRYGMSYTFARTDEGIEDLLLKRLRESGLVKR
ncbi:MAG: DUF58 domain-containing protein [Candidatus Sumerlaeota bacterium]|nr:DUF58 domain-containing protein [Candidatus Sumerlaeota bacterium]